MNKSDLLTHAAALREQSKFRDAYDAFLCAANSTDSILEKSAILLDAVTNLTMLDDFESGRDQLKRIEEMLSAVDPRQLTQADRNEFLRVLIWIDIEDAEIFAAEGKIEKAIEKLTATLDKFKLQLEEPGLITACDELQCRRAYFLADVGSFEKAIPVLEEVENRRNNDSIFLFYLGYCYYRAKRLNEARQELERAIEVGLRSGVAFQTHGALGMVCYELGDYLRAKKELETSARLATPRYIKEQKIWKWLEYTCRELGLQAEARRYAQLANPS